MKKDSRIIVFGAGGLIGSEIVKILENSDYNRVIACRHKDLDLINQSGVNRYFEENQPEYVFFCATRSITNFESGEVIDAVELYSNLMMQMNVMEAARLNEVKKAVFIGSAMLYPWNHDHDDGLLKEEYLEDFRVNQYRDSMKSSVISKYVCMKLCQYYHEQYGSRYIYAIPTHIYGNFAGRKNLYFLENMVMELCDAKLQEKEEVYLDIFGEGKAKKQILHVHDCAKALISLAESYEDYSEPVNIGSLEIESWGTIVDKICSILDYHGTVRFNAERSERMENRICDIKKLTDIGWKPEISMKDGLKSLCNEYMSMKRS